MSVYEPSEYGGRELDESPRAAIFTLMIPPLMSFYGTASVPRSHSAVYDPGAAAKNDVAHGIWFHPLYRCLLGQIVVNVLLNRRNGWDGEATLLLADHELL
jgi:hypothetical protein